MTMTRDLFIGVDPGASKTSGRGGGLAIIDESCRVVGAFVVPVMDYVVTTKASDPKPILEVDAVEFYDLLCRTIDLRFPGGNLYAMIEEPPRTPIKFKDDKKGKGKGSWRTPFDVDLKAKYGAIRALLRLLCRDRVESVYAQTWKPAFGVTRDKQTALDAAQDMFPEVDLRHKKQHNIAEALLIARYLLDVVVGRRTMAAIEGAQQ